MPEEIQESEDIRTAKLRPQGSVIRVKTTQGFAIYELTRQGWKLIREEKQ